MDSITYIETDLHRLIFHDNESFTYVKHQSMKECEEEFKDTDFLRINSSYLVNLRYANNIQGGDMILSDGTRLKISRPRMNQVVKTFLDFKK
jgi:DNA-binding LytR/AlgR family response regulator